LGLVDINDKAGERAHGAKLRHGPVEDVECRNVEELEELACVLMHIAQEA
jgi:hypothetical protein